ncbi:hypothetical protein H072_1276 [Dactylellina haptotyla CBS 200.50]|uniref:SCD domain-containing protein n=1 Tax=Dactylellina haptotyla (strain CBS 200.50) TaxID=1284197 RepID=S8AUX1_DACHA|nr:hypothetical protein H072_1276 [Dactylellina haptotyla CBS 200.50]
MSATTSTQTPTRTSLTIIGRMATAGEGSSTPEPSAESSQRRSTRVRKAPPTYSPPPTTQQRKRKRDTRVGAADNASEDEDAAASDDGSEEQSDATDASDQEEEEDAASEDESIHVAPSSRKKTANRGKAATPNRAKPAKAPARKPAPKKSRTDAGPPAKGRATPRKKSGTVNGVVELDGDDLFDRVLAGEDASKIVQDWIDHYDSNNTDAMVAMVNFILRSCGCNQSVTSDDIEDADSAASKLEDIQDVFQKESSVEYPIASRAQKYRRYRTCLTSFFSELINHISASGVLTSDPALIENMQIWITAMSSSPLRPFRHTSTAINLAITTALCATMADIEKSINNSTKQLESEKSKSRKNQGRIKSLESQINEVQENQEFVTDQISDIYESVFVHRYRDVDGKIRAECIHELGIWILKLPSIFFEASYLRYLGWVLSDTAVSVRSEVIKALTKLFKDRTNVGGLRNFTERFRERLVEMALQDADSGVRAETISLLSEVRQVGFLEPDDIESIGKLLYDADIKVRNAVADFFINSVQEGYDEQLEDCGGEDTVMEALQTAGDLDDEDFEGHQISWIKFKCLVNSLSAYDQDDSADNQTRETNAKGIAGLGLQSRFQLAGLALYKALPELHKWEDLAKYLLYDHTGNQMNGSDDETLSYIKTFCALKAKEENILLHVLHASVTSALAAAADGPTTHTKSKRKQSEAPDEDDIARSLAHLVPLLLNKFGAAPETTSTVLRISHLMKLDIYQELRQMNTYSLLIDDVVKQFMTHLDESVLKEASGFLLHAATFDELEEATSQKITSMQDEVVNYLVSLASSKNLEKGDLSDQSLSDLETAVKRLQYLASITDCKEAFDSNGSLSQSKPKNKKGKEVVRDSSATESPAQILIAIIGRGKNSDDAESDLWLASLKTLLYYFMWNVEAITKLNLSTDAAVDEHLSLLESLRSKEVAITAHLENIINIRELDQVRIAAAGALLDFHTFNALLSATTKLSMFPRKVPEEVQEDILKVYISAEKRFAKLSNKVVASGSDDEGEESEENTDLEVAILFEQRLCEFVGKITLAVLGEVVDATIFKARLLKNRSQLGPNLREILNHLDPPKPRPSRAKPKTKPATSTNAGKVKSLEVIEDSDEEAQPNEEAHEEELLRHEEMEREEEEDHQKRQESVAEGDEDEEMVDAD